MTCQHLAPLEQELLTAGIQETCRGQAWTKACREWVYFDAILDTDALAARLRLPACVQVHENRDEKSGRERGFFCTHCRDGVMGKISGAKVYR